MPEERTPQQIKDHYDIEKDLANQLRRASRQERRFLYRSVYDELFQRVPHHPQLTHKISSQERMISIGEQIRFIHPYLNPNSIFLEVGPGDCALSLEVAKRVKIVYAVDVSDQITRGFTPPANFRLILSDGCSIPVEKNSVNIAFSYQLMEHLHPDDAVDQLRNLYEALAPGGVYICITPNRLSGPHDISRYFDKVATGFHLKEYTVFELANLFKQAGFSKVKVIFGIRGRYTDIPVFIPVICEKILSLFPDEFIRAVASQPPFRQLLGVRIIGIKQ